MDYDLRSDLLSVIGVVPTSITADASYTIDTQSAANIGFKSLTLEVYVGVGGITFDPTNKIEVKVTHSDDNVNYVAVTDDDLILDYNSDVTLGLPDANGTVRALTALHAAAENFLVGYRGKKRYVKVTFDFSGTHGSGTVLGLNWLLSHSQIKPVWQASVPDMV